MSVNATSNHVGATSESAVEYALLKAGYRVLKPTVVSRYDIGVDSSSGFIRVQVKTGRRDKSNNLRVTWDGTYAPDEIDVLAVFDPPTSSTWFVPLSSIVVGAAGFTLRLPTDIRGRALLRSDRRSLDAERFTSFGDALNLINGGTL